MVNEDGERGIRSESDVRLNWWNGYVTSTDLARPQRCCLPLVNRQREKATLIWRFGDVPGRIRGRHRAAESALHIRRFFPCAEGAVSNANGMVTFLSDHTIAVGMCSKTVCNLATFDVKDGKTHQTDELSGVERFHAIIRVGDSRMLLGGVSRGGQRGAILLDEGLHTSRWIPTVPGTSLTGEEIPAGQGRLLSHTGNLAAYFDQGIVRIYGSGGTLLGSFTVRSSRTTPAITFLGKNRILLKGTRGAEVRDFNGTVLRKLKKPGKALGEGTRQSEDGFRLLYDSFIRRVGAIQTAVEKALVIPTMGMSEDSEVPNGELVRVIDTESGNRCFEWYGKEKLLPPFLAHADIDPSGRLVAILTKDTITVFKLADTCR